MQCQSHRGRNPDVDVDAEHGKPVEGQEELQQQGSALEKVDESGCQGSEPADGRGTRQCYQQTEEPTARKGDCRQYQGGLGACQNHPDLVECEITNHGEPYLMG
ncbi:hypothetical protein CDEF62S_04549 [Castellaniella defragrans]